MYCFLTVTLKSWPVWFTTMGAETSHIVTDVFSSTLTTWGVTIAAIEMWWTYYNSQITNLLIDDDLEKFAYDLLLQEWHEIGDTDTVTRYVVFLFIEKLIFCSKM